LGHKLKRKWNPMTPTHEILSKKPAIVAELVTADGPSLDDHFLVIVDEGGRIAEIATDDIRLRGIAQEIEQMLGITIEFGLANRTDFASRVIYPEHLRNRPLFTLAEKARGVRAIADWVRRFGAVERSVEFTSDAKDYLNALKR